MPQADPYQKDLDLLLEYARAAGEIARSKFKRDIDKWEKDGGAGPVTEADIAIDRMLKAELIEARPDYGWLSEETEDDTARCNHDLCFIVDPIDGTRAFMRGDDTFCHALAVADKGVIVAAAAYFPIKDEMYWATKGGGAFLQGDAIRVSEKATLDGATALAGQPQMNPDRWPGGPPPVTREFRNSLVYRHCLVADGTFDMAFTFRPAWEWDVATGELIAEEAGAMISTQHGDRWVYNSHHPRMPGVVIAPPVLHSALLQRL